MRAKHIEDLFASEQNQKRPKRGSTLLLGIIFHERSVSPQLLELVETAQFGLENVDHDIHLVHGDPHAVLLAFDAPDLLAQLLEHPFLDSVGDGAHLRRGVRVADDEM